VTVAGVESHAAFRIPGQRACTCGSREHPAHVSSDVGADSGCFDPLRRHVPKRGRVVWIRFLHGHRRDQVKRIILTASGGPFLHRPAEDFATVRIEEALKHPTWKMGNKITIDSATLMNKGLEVIEARWLFDLSPERISVIIHPQSIVHSMVEYVDGSVLAQLGIPDMAIPISYILAYPERLPLTHLPSLDLVAAQQLTFFPPDFGKFPCLRLAYEVLSRGDTYPAVLNATNEVAVEGFLTGQVQFTEIPDLNNRVLDAHSARPVRNLNELIAADEWARAQARTFLSRRVTRTAVSA